MHTGEVGSPDSVAEDAPERLGIPDLKAIHSNPGVAQLAESAIARQEGLLADGGALVVRTGQFTGRSPGDKYIVDDEITHSSVNWGPVNQAMSEANFDNLHDRALHFLRG